MSERDRLLLSFHLCLAATILKGRIILIGGDDDAAYKNGVDCPWGTDCEVDVVWRMSEWRDGFDVFTVNGVDYRVDKKALWWLGITVQNAELIERVRVPEPSRIRLYIKIKMAPQQDVKPVVEG